MSLQTKAATLTAKALNFIKTPENTSFVVGVAVASVVMAITTMRAQAREAKIEATQHPK